MDPLHVPPGQGVAALEPSPAQKWATGHGSHRVALDAFWNSPGEHGTQLARPLSLAAEPGLHGLGVDTPVEHADPGGHVLQSSGLVRPCEAPYVPCSHGSAAEAPSSQNEPRMQTSHAVSPLPA